MKEKGLLQRYGGPFFSDTLEKIHEEMRFYYARRF